MDKPGRAVYLPGRQTYSQGNRLRDGMKNADGKIPQTMTNA